MPKVSIVVPIYNVEKYLRECLDSLINQTLKDIEIICVNDGSTDSSPAIIEEYAKKDSRIKVINKENSGYGHTMNVGIASATADYIGVLESDDFAKPEMFESLYLLIKENDCDLVKSDFYNYFSNPENILKLSIFEGLPTNKITSARNNIKILNTIPSVWSALYKKIFLVKNDIKFLETPGASYQDLGFHYKTLMQAKKLILTNNAYVYYRNDNLNSSVKSANKIYCLNEEFEELHRYIHKHKELDYFEQFVYAGQFASYRWNLNRIDKKFKKQFFKSYYSEFKNYYQEGLLKEKFYKYLKKGLDFDLFITKPKKFYKKCLQREQTAKWNELKRKFISVRINRERISIKLFGKQVVRIGG